MTAIPNKTVAEIVTEYGIPKEFEGAVKFMQEQFIDLMKRAGESEEHARKQASLLGASLVAREGRDAEAVKNAFTDRNEYDEKRLIGHLLRFQADPSGNRRVRTMPAEKLFPQINEAIERGAFGMALTKLVDDGKIETKTISDASHGNLVLTAYSNEVIYKRYLISRFLEFAQVVPMPQAMVRWPKVTSDTPTIVKHTRGTQETPDDITIGNVTLTANELFGSILIPNETLRDSGPNLIDVIFRVIGTQMRRKQLLQYATGAGTGSGEPLGIENGTYTKEVTVNGSLTWRHLVRAINTLGDEWTMAPDEDGLCWVMNQAVKEVCQLLEDDSGRPIFMRLETTPLTTVGNVAPTVRPETFTMLGVPGVVLPGLAGTATPSDESAIHLVAGKAAYYAGTREDFNLFPSEHVEAKRNSTYIRGTMGHDGQVAQADAVCVLSGITG